jgi:surface protein
MMLSSGSAISAAARRPHVENAAAETSASEAEVHADSDSGESGSNVSTKAAEYQAPYIRGSTLYLAGSNWNKSTLYSFTTTNDLSVTAIRCENGTVLPEECDYLFAPFKNVTEIDLTNADLSQIRTMFGMFSSREGLTKLKTVKFPDVRTSNVIEMTCMFSRASALEEVDFGNFNTSSVTDMRAMFYECTSLKKVDMSSFANYKLENIRQMFYNCRSIKEIYVGRRWGRRDIYYTEQTFTGCTNIYMWGRTGIDPESGENACIDRYFTLNY